MTKGKVSYIQEDVAEQLLKEWAPIINYTSSKVKPLTEHRDRLNMAIVLQNQMHYLAENTNTSVYGNSQPTAGVFSGDNYARGDARLPKVLIPMIRRTFCENITNEIVGVQPMSGPVGSAWALRFFYEPTALNQRDFPQGADPHNFDRDGHDTPWAKNRNGSTSRDGDDHRTNPQSDAYLSATRGTSTTDMQYKHPFPPAPVSGEEGKVDNEAWQDEGHEAGYNWLNTSYTGAKYKGYDDIIGAAVTASGVAGDSEKEKAVNSMIAEADKGVARLVSDYEQTGRIPQMTIDIQKTVVEARSRKLAASWSTEIEQDLKAQNGIDISAELTTALSYEIQAETDREMVSRMKAICLKAGTRNPATGNGFSFWDCGTSDARWLGERARDLYSRIVVEANRIAVRNRRGPANFIIATPRVCALLELGPDYKVMPLNGTVDTANQGTAKAGTVGGRFTIYRDTRSEAYYDMGAIQTPVEYALLGYKGSEYYDTGIVYCPYIPVMLQSTIGPNDFSPRMGVMTRYGVADNIFGADQYYHLLICLGFGQLRRSSYLANHITLA